MARSSVEVHLEIGPLGLIVPVEITFSCSPGFPGNYWQPPDPPEQYWEAYQRLDGLLDHDGIEDAVEAYWTKYSDDIATKFIEDCEPQEPDY